VRPARPQRAKEQALSPSPRGRSRSRETRSRPACQEGGGERRAARPPLSRGAPWRPRRAFRVCSWEGLELVEEDNEITFSGRPHADPLPCLEHHASTERTRAVGASGLDDQEHEHGRELRVGRPGPVTHPAARLDGELACGCLARERRTYDERHRTRAKGRVLGRGMLQARREPMLGSPVWAVGRVTEEKGVTEPLLYVAEAEVMTSARIMAG